VSSIDLILQKMKRDFEVKSQNSGQTLITYKIFRTI
jgi:hypothetical protein